MKKILEHVSTIHGQNLIIGYKDMQIERHPEHPSNILATLIKVHPPISITSSKNLLYDPAPRILDPCTILSRHDAFHLQGLAGKFW